MINWLYTYNISVPTPESSGMGLLAHQDGGVVTSVHCKHMNPIIWLLESANIQFDNPLFQDGLLFGEVATVAEFLFTCCSATVTVAMVTSVGGISLVMKLSYPSQFAHLQS